jgi:hypothetical protein
MSFEKLQTRKISTYLKSDMPIIKLLYILI